MGKKVIILLTKKIGRAQIFKLGKQLWYVDYELTIT